MLSVLGLAELVDTVTTRLARPNGSRGSETGKEASTPSCSAVGASDCDGRAVKSELLADSASAGCDSGDDVECCDVEGSLSIRPIGKLKTI